MSYTYTKEKDTFTAIYNLVGGGLGGSTDGTSMSYDDGQTPPTQAEIQAEIDRLNKEFSDNEYARNRKAKYDALNQFEMQFDDEVNGTTTWKDAIAKIKADNPKPE